MPCNSDYMNASSIEIEMSRVACLLDELAGKKWTRSYWDGYHPAAYGKAWSKDFRDKMVAELCSSLQGVAVGDYSLEMQMWWRDHQEADKKRLLQEQKEMKRDADREEALKKLNRYERALLGY